MPNFHVMLYSRWQYFCCGH